MEGWGGAQRRLCIYPKMSIHIFLYIFAFVDDGFRFPNVENIDFHDSQGLAKCLTPIAGLKNGPFWPGCPQQPFIIFFDLSDPHVFTQNGMGESQMPR